MSSATTAAAEEYRLSQWAEDIRDCQARPENMSVKEWCHAHGITKANYYYRLRRVRLACLKNAEAPVFAPVPIPLSSPSPAITNLERPVAVLHFPSGSVEIQNTISPKLLEQMVRVMCHVQ